MSTTNISLIYSSCVTYTSLKRIQSCLTDVTWVSIEAFQLEGYFSSWNRNLLVAVDQCLLPTSGSFTHVRHGFYNVLGHTCFIKRIQACLKDVTWVSIEAFQLEGYFSSWNKNLLVADQCPLPI